MGTYIYTNMFYNYPKKNMSLNVKSALNKKLVIFFVIKHHELWIDEKNISKKRKNRMIWCKNKLF